MTEKPKKQAARKRTKKTDAEDSKAPVFILPVLKNMGQAQTCGFPRAFLRRAKKAGCKGFRSDGRINLQELIHWTFADSGDDETDWSQRLTRAKAEREELRLANERKEMGNRDEMRSAMQAAFAVYDTEVETQLLSIQPPKAVGLTAPEIAELNKSMLQTAREKAKKILSEA